MGGLLLAALLAQGAAASPAPMVALPPAAGASGAGAPAGGHGVSNTSTSADAGTGVADAGALALPEAMPLGLKGVLDHTPVTLGEPFSLRLEVRHDPSDAYELPANLGETLAKGFVLLRGEPTVAREPAADGARTTFTMSLVVNGSLKPELPEFKLLVQGPAGPRQATVPGQKIELESLVEREGQPNAEHAHHGPKPPEPVYVRSFLWAFLLLAIAALVAGVVALRRWQERRRAIAALPPPPPSPHEEAFRRLKALRLRAPWTRGEGRTAIFELSEIVRHYLGERFGFTAIDLTSEELVRDLRRRNLPEIDLVDFAERLEWEDLVKFARLEPAARECEEAIDRAGAMVEVTQERMVRERHADLGAAT